MLEKPEQARMSRIVLVSNRVTDIRKAPQAGGVAVALADIVRTRPALWFGWNGEIKPDHTTAPVEREGRMATVPLSEADHQAYYLGYSNSVLWPVFHNRLDLAQFEAGFFERYVGVNRRLAEQLQPLLRSDDLIWVHDYHLLPFATELRRLGAQNPIGFFLHIPFPPWQTFMAIPEHQQLARALAAYDLIGLQTKADVANLVTYLENGVFGRIVPDGRIRLLDRLVSVGSFPIGIDVADFAHAKRDSGLVQARRASAHRIIGVDRLDYTKGLPQKFKAFGQFLESNPRYRGQVVLTQIAPPTRGSVEAYADIRQQLEILGRLHQWPLRRARLGADPLHPPLDGTAPAGRHLPLLPHRACHALARWYESGRQGVRRGAGWVRSRRPRAFAIRWRCRRNEPGSDRQSLQHRRNRRRHPHGLRNGPARAPEAARGIDGDG